MSPMTRSIPHKQKRGAPDRFHDPGAPLPHFCPRNAEGAPPKGEAPPSKKNVRRCPTLPHSLPCSTIGAGELNYRVRNGTGCFPSAKTTEQPTHPTPTHVRGGGSLHDDRHTHIHLTNTVPSCFLGTTQGREHHTNGFALNVRVFKPLGLLVPVDSTRYRASIPGLSTRSSTGGLTPTKGWENSSQGRLPA